MRAIFQECECRTTGFRSFEGKHGIEAVTFNMLLERMAVVIGDFVSLEQGRYEERKGLCLEGLEKGITSIFRENGTRKTAYD